MMNFLRRADIILSFDNNRILHKIINWVELHEGDPPSFAHAGLFAHSLVTIEAEKHVTKEYMFKYFNDHTHIAVIRPEIPSIKRRNILDRAAMLIGTDYGYRHLFLLGLNKFFRTDIFTKLIPKSELKPVCSTFISNLFWEIAGLKINGKDPENVSPDDFYDDVSGLFNLIFEGTGLELYKALFDDIDEFLKKCT